MFLFYDALCDYMSRSALLYLASTIFTRNVKIMSNPVDPVIASDVAACTARAAYYNQAADTEVNLAVECAVGGKDRAMHLARASNFYDKAVRNEKEGYLLRSWFSLGF